MKKYEFVTDCVHSTYELITDMVEHARKITYRTFCKYVNIAELNDLFGYDRYGLRLKKDYHVTYYRGKYNGVRCVFMCHSAIEYIYCPVA